MMNRIFGFKHKYPDGFFKTLEKLLGVKFTKNKATLIPREEIEVKPLPPPSGTIYYIDFKYGNNK